MARSVTLVHAPVLPMNNLRHSPASLLAALSLAFLLAASGNAFAGLSLDPGFGTNGVVQVGIGPGSDSASDVARQSDGALVLVGRSRQTIDSDPIDHVALTRLDPDTGEIDDSFGTDGIVTFLPGLAAADGGGGQGRAIAIRPADQKILVTGSWKESADADSQVFVARLLPTGELDTDFGNDGVVLLVPGTTTDATGLAIALRDDDSIIIAGTATDGEESAGFVTALDEDGGALAGFNTAVVANPLEDGENFRFNALAILDDGAILAGGGGGDLTLVQLDPNGNPDPGFGTEGIATFNYQSFDTAEGPQHTFEIVSDIAVLADGRILLTGRAGLDSGFSPSNWVLARATSTGELDASFGSGGFAPLPDDNAQEAPEAVGVRASGDIVIAGLGMPVTQISPNGISIESIDADPVFQTTGFVGLQILPGGDVIGIGLASVSGSNTAFAAARLAVSDLADGPDTVPDPFGFPTKDGVELGATVVSDAIIITGLDAPAAISASSGAKYSIGCTGTFTTATGTINDGDSVCLQIDAAAATSLTPTTVLLNVGGAVGIFSAITGDATPDEFSFGTVDPVERSTVVTSGPVTLAGFAINAPISVSGGEYSIGCTGTFKSTAGTVAPGATVCVRHTSSAAGGTTTTTTLKVGPGAVVSGTFSSKTEGVQDTTPDPFSFTNQTNVALGTVITSGAVAIGGFDTSAPISVTGGTYSIGCTASFTASDGTLPPNSSVCVRHTSALNGGTVTETVLTVGGVSAAFSSTTRPGDADPADFDFVDQTGVGQDEIITSAPVTITGIDIASPVSVSGGEYSVGCTNTYTASPGTISNGKTVCVRHRSSFEAETSTTTTLNVGPKTRSFTSTTGTSDQTPDAFSFATRENSALSIVVLSDPVTVSGVDGPVRIQMSGPTRVVNNPFPTVVNDFGLARDCDERNIDSNASGTILRNGDTFCVAVISPATDLSSVTVTVTLGGSAPETQVTATFQVNTGETVPDDFSFVDRVGVPLNSVVVADPVTITGITAPSAVRITNGEYQINCTGPFTRLAGLVENNQTICVRQFTPGTLGALTTTTLSVGGVTGTFSSTTTTETKPLPGSSAIDLWSLLLLAPLVARRRRL